MNKIIGVLWKKEKDGREYYSGVLNDLRGNINIAVFSNTRKEADNQPDMNIVISWSNPGEKKENDSEDESNKPTKKKQSRKTNDDQETKDEMPF